MAKTKPKKLDGISSQAAQKATGHDWAEWISILDKAGAKDWNHKEIVAYLKDNHKIVRLVAANGHGRLRDMNGMNRLLEYTKYISVLSGIGGM